METINDCCVGRGCNEIMILKMEPRMALEKALRLAAWIVAVADESPDHADFKAVLEAVENS